MPSDRRRGRARSGPISVDLSTWAVRTRARRRRFLDGAQTGPAVAFGSMRFYSITILRRTTRSPRGRIDGQEARACIGVVRVGKVDTVGNEHVEVQTQLERGIEALHERDRAIRVGARRATAQLAGTSTLESEDHAQDFAERERCELRIRSEMPAHAPGKRSDPLAHRQARQHAVDQVRGGVVHAVGGSCTTGRCRGPCRRTRPGARACNGRRRCGRNRARGCHSASTPPAPSSSAATSLYRSVCSGSWRRYPAIEPRWQYTSRAASRQREESRRSQARRSSGPSGVRPLAGIRTCDTMLRHQSPAVGRKARAHERTARPTADAANGFEWHVIRAEKPKLLSRVEQFR